MGVAKKEHPMDKVIKVLCNVGYSMTTVLPRQLIFFKSNATKSNTSCREFNRNPNIWETKKIEKTHAKESNQMHKTIFTWFGNFTMSTELQGFHYYQGKVQKCGYNIFSLPQKTRQQPYKTLITKVDSTMG